MHRTSRILLRIIIAGAIVFFAVSILVWDDYYNKPLPVKEHTIEFIVQPGMTLHQVANSLHQLGVIKYPKEFIALAYLRNKAKLIRAGEYQITDKMTQADLLQKLIDGDVIQYQITLIEGWNFEQVKKALMDDPYLKHDMIGLSEKQIAKRIGVKHNSLEGVIFPNTYQFPRGTSDLKLLKIAATQSKKILQIEWQARDLDVPYQTPYDALIAASLIEKEAKLPAERQKVAGVIVRRLNKKMRLQIDSTVLFGVNKTQVEGLTKSDLRKDTPYNSYLHKGLPPTPIALPSRASLSAALHPHHSENIYFVAKGDGSHQFSVTLDEHRDAIKKYLDRAEK